MCSGEKRTEQQVDWNVLRRRAAEGTNQSESAILERSWARCKLWFSTVPDGHTRVGAVASSAQRPGTFQASQSPVRPHSQELPSPEGQWQGKTLLGLNETHSKERTASPSWLRVYTGNFHVYVNAHSTSQFLSCVLTQGHYLAGDHCTRLHFINNLEK